MDDKTAQDELVAAADLLFTARGIRSVGTDDIRDASGVPLKQLYRLFSSKEALAIEVLSRWETSALLAFQEATASYADPRAALLPVFDVVADWAKSRGIAAAPPQHIRRDGFDVPNLAQIARHQKLGLIAFLDDLVSDLDGPNDLSAQLLVLLNGAIGTSAVLEVPEVVAHAKAAALALLDGAIGSPTRPRTAASLSRPNTPGSWRRSRSFQGTAHQRCRVHFARNLLAHVPKSHADMVAAVIRSIFAQPDPNAVNEAWDEVRDELATSFPKVGPIMDDAKPRSWRSQASRRPTGARSGRPTRASGSTRRSNAAPVCVGTFPNAAAVIRLVGGSSSTCTTNGSPATATTSQRVHGAAQADHGY